MGLNKTHLLDVKKHHFWTRKRGPHGWPPVRGLFGDPKTQNLVMRTPMKWKSTFDIKKWLSGHQNQHLTSNSVLELQNRSWGVKFLSWHENHQNWPPKTVFFDTKMWLFNLLVTTIVNEFWVVKVIIFSTLRKHPHGWPPVRGLFWDPKNDVFITKSDFFVLSLNPTVLLDLQNTN